MTDALIARGIDPGRLVLVEYDPQFCKLLQRRYPRATVIQGDAYDLAVTLDGVLDEPAATVVSSLPLRNQPERDRLTLLEQAFAVLQPGGSFVQFTYGIASPMPLRSGRPPLLRGGGVAARCGSTCLRPASGCIAPPRHRR